MMSRSNATLLLSDIHCSIIIMNMNIAFSHSPMATFLLLLLGPPSFKRRLVFRSHSNHHIHLIHSPTHFINISSFSAIMPATRPSSNRLFFFFFFQLFFFCNTGIITVPGTTPATNPVNPPVPVTNPVTTPSTNPPPTSSGGNGRGQSWCIAKNGASQAALQSALDYACGIGGADCATIQQGSSCYEPATLQNHASYAFNSYYQNNPLPTSCDFAGAAALTTTNPSTGSCVYPSPSSSTSSPTTPVTQGPPTTPVTQGPPTTPVTQGPPTTPVTQGPPTTPEAPPTTPTTQAPPTTPTTQAPVNPTSLPTAPTTSSSYSGSTSPGTQSPPPGFSFGNPDPTGLGAYGASPPLENTASVISNNLVGSLVAVAFIILFGLFDC